MYAPPFVRAPHPCLAAPCGHPDDRHVLVPELAHEGEEVVFCSVCGRNEVGKAARSSRPRRGSFELAWALPHRPV